VTDFPQTNYRRVNAVPSQPCASCHAHMDPRRAWWWTWHGATCTEGCAQALITEHHGADPCDERCRP
jgi:hypothetical protein